MHNCCICNSVSLNCKAKKAAKQGIEKRKGYTKSASNTDLQTWKYLYTQYNDGTFNKSSFLDLFSPETQDEMQEIQVILFLYWTYLFLSSQMLYLLIF